MRTAAVLSATLLVLAPLSALGRGRGDAEEGSGTSAARVHVQAGIAHFGDGHYDDALREMETARRLHPSPELDYNVAQCLERLGRLDEALAAYRGYVRDRGRAADVHDVEAHIVELERRLAQTAAPTRAPPEVVKEVVFKTIVVYRDAPPLPGRGARWAAIGLTVLGAGALAAFIGTLVVAQRDLDRVSSGGSVDAPIVFDGALRDAENNQRSLQIASWVSLGVAALSFAGAGGLFALGRKIDREAPKLTFAPLGPARTAGATVAVRF